MSYGVSGGWCERFINMSYGVIGGWFESLLKCCMVCQEDGLRVY